MCCSNKQPHISMTKNKSLFFTYNMFIWIYRKFTQWVTQESRNPDTSSPNLFPWPQRLGKVRYYKFFTRASSFKSDTCHFCLHPIRQRISDSHVWIQQWQVDYILANRIQFTSSLSPGCCIPREQNTYWCTEDTE